MLRLIAYTIIVYAVYDITRTALLTVARWTDVKKAWGGCKAEIIDVIADITFTLATVAVCIAYIMGF
jgi:hypothetical protein